jgi:hypothetical protein
MRVVGLRGSVVEVSLLVGYDAASLDILLVPDVSTKRTDLNIKSLEVRTSRPLKMKTCSFETSGTDSHVTRRHIPEEWYPLISGSMKGEELDQLSGYQLLKVFIP